MKIEINTPHPSSSMNYTRVAPLSRERAFSHTSTLRASRLQANSAFGLLSDIWQVVLNCFKSLFHCFGLFSKPTSPTDEEKPSSVLRVQTLPNISATSVPAAPTIRENSSSVPSVQTSPSNSVTQLSPTPTINENRPDVPNTVPPTLAAGENDLIIVIEQTPSNISAMQVPMTVIERENRLDATPAQINQRLIEQMQRSMEQMRCEPPKSFQYRVPPENWGEYQDMEVGGLPVGISSAQGRRLAMEDAHLAVSFDLRSGPLSYAAKLFGIFDGHGGSLAAEFVRDNLQRVLKAALVDYNEDGLTNAGIWRALKMTCVRLNRAFKERHDANYTGTTVTFALILNQHIWTANVGDSRIILNDNGIPHQLTEDAKPSDPRYGKGIANRGGEVADQRVNGILATARAIGDFEVIGVSARPKITVKPLSQIQPGSHLVLGCDGIYDVATTTNIVAAVLNNSASTLGKLASNIVFSAYESGSMDNLSVMLVKIK